MPTLQDLLQQREDPQTVDQFLAPAPTATPGPTSLSGLSDQRTANPPPALPGASATLQDLLQQRASGSKSQIKANPRAYNAMPVGNVLVELGTYGGPGAKQECVGGVRNIASDFPSVGFTYKGKLGAIQPGQGPEEGVVAIIPSGKVGHVAMVLGVDGDDLLIYDVNADLKNGAYIRKIPQSSVDGYWKGDPTKVNIKQIEDYKNLIPLSPSSEEQESLDQATALISENSIQRVFDEIRGDNPEFAEEIGALQAFAAKHYDGLSAVKEGLTSFSDPFVGAMKGLAVLLDDQILGPAHDGFKSVFAWGAEKAGLDSMADYIREAPTADLTKGVEEVFGLQRGTLDEANSGFQEIGFMMEKMTEFLVASKGAQTAVSGILKNPKLASLPGRLKGAVELGMMMVAEGLAGGGTSAFQEGEVFRADGSLNPAVKWNALLGAGVTGLLGGPSFLKKTVRLDELFGQVKKIPIVSDFTDKIIKAIRPAKNAVQGFTKSIDDVIDEVFKINPNIKSIEELNSVIRELGSDTWAKVKAGLGAAGAKGGQIDGNLVADEILTAIKANEVLMTKFPKGLKVAKQWVKRFRKPLDMNLAQDLLSDSNASMSTFFKALQKQGIGIGGLEESLEIALESGFIKSLRGAIDTTLDSLNVPAIKPLRDLYSKISNVAPAINARANLITTRGPLNLQTQLAIPAGFSKMARALTGNYATAAEGLAQTGASLGIKKFFQDADFAIEKAFNGIRKGFSPSGTLGPFINSVKSMVQGTVGQSVGPNILSRDVDEADRKRQEFLKTASSPFVGPGLKAAGGAVGGLLKQFSPESMAAGPQGQKPFGPQQQPPSRGPVFKGASRTSELGPPMPDFGIKAPAPDVPPPNGAFGPSLPTEVAKDRGIFSSAGAPGFGEQVDSIKNFGQDDDKGLFSKAFDLSKKIFPGSFFNS
jgi:hypothetical protein